MSTEQAQQDLNKENEHKQENENEKEMNQDQPLQSDPENTMEVTDGLVEEEGGEGDGEVAGMEEDDQVEEDNQVEEDEDDEADEADDDNLAIAVEEEEEEEQEQVTAIAIAIDNDNDNDNNNDAQEAAILAAGVAEGQTDTASQSEAIEESADTANKPKTKKRKKKAKGETDEPQKPGTILHLVFDQAGGEQIKQSFELEPEIAGEIIFIEDNYSLGPVMDLQEPEGWQTRKLWWQSVLGLSEEEQPEVMTSDKMKMHQLLQQLEDEDTALWIWMGQNERDVAGYFQVISQLMVFQGRIHVLYLNNLPFIDEKGHIFYPRQLSEILPKEFVKAARLARVVTLSEFELDPEEWDKLSKQPGAVRLLEGGKKLTLKENDYYDKLILDQLGAATMKLPRLIAQLATKAKLGLPEYYIVWRIKSLVESGQIVSQGDFDKGIKNVSLKATQGQLFVQLDPEQASEDPDETTAT